MRKITRESCHAFKNQTNYRLDNSEVVTKEDDTCILTRYYLHGNKIATLYNRKKDNKKQLYITNCGYETNVTKERLNGILDEFQLGGIHQKNFTRYIETKDEYVKFPSGKKEGYGFTF